MKIQFDQLPEKRLESFWGGEGALCAKMYVDEQNKILRGVLAPGHSIGYHIHDTSSEIIFFLSGSGKTVTDDAEFIKQSIYKRSDSDPLIDELLLKYADTIAPAYRKLGYNPTTLNSSSIKQLVAELYYEFGNEVWGSEYNLVLGGGYLSVRNPYNLYKGEVTYSDVYTLLPFDNQIVLCSIKGEDLYYNFIATENEDYYVYLGEYGESIKDSIDFNATYYVVTDTYTSTYAPNNMTEIERYSEDVFARDLLAEYIENIG